MKKYDEVLIPFLELMRKELHANSSKGDREGWLAMQPWEILLELFYHMGKLQKVVKNNDFAGIREYSSDVANLSMMMTDRHSLLPAMPDDVDTTMVTTSRSSLCGIAWDAELALDGHINHPDALKKIMTALQALIGEKPDYPSHHDYPQAGVAGMVAALHQIVRWDGFPATGKTWPESGAPMSYSACNGSNGERDFMRQVAIDALSNLHPQEPSQKITERMNRAKEHVNKIMACPQPQAHPARCGCEEKS